MEPIDKYPPGGKESTYGDPKFTLQTVVRWANAINTSVQGGGRGIVISWTGKLAKENVKAHHAVVESRHNERSRQKNDRKMFLHHYLNNFPVKVG